MQLNNVDFPEPLGPIKEKTSPSFTSNDTPFRATTPENCMCRLLICKSAMTKKAPDIKIEGFII
jgi:hypothetical protein